MANRVKTFEEQLTRLEEIVKLLDEGDLPLEKSLKLFEEGVSLARKCSVNLTDARGKLESMMVTNDNSIETKEFEIQ